MFRVAPPGSFHALTLYRLTVFGRPHGPWHQDRRMAQRDAWSAGLGEFEQATGRFFLTVPAEIETVRVIKESRGDAPTLAVRGNPPQDWEGDHA